MDLPGFHAGDPDEEEPARFLQRRVRDRLGGARLRNLGQHALQTLRDEYVR